MTEQIQDRLREQLEKLKRRADQQATAHAWLRDRYQLIHAIFTTGSLVAGAFLLAIVMAAPEYIERTLGIPAINYPWLTALLAAGSFSVVIVQLAWRPDARAALHDQAVRHYTKAAYRSSTALQSGQNLHEDDVTRIRDDYLDDRDLPRVPERKFLRLKQWHLLKVRMSKELDKSPGVSLRALRRQLELEAAAKNDGPEKD